MYCDLEIWKGLDNRIKYENGINLETALSKKTDFRKNALIFAGKHHCKDNVLYSVTQYDETLDIITKISYFQDTWISDAEITELTSKFSFAEFGILYAKQLKKLCEKTLKEENSKHIIPITLKEANAFVSVNHRHHDAVRGCKFAIGLQKTTDNVPKLIGVAICGRPVSRYLDDRYTLEINRLCTTETGNCCSMLYGACAKIAKDMGYRKVITYILKSESGTSLKASGFVLEDACCGGKSWTGQRKRPNGKTPEEMKQRWSKILNQ